LNWRKNYFSQLLNVHRANDVRQIEIHASEPLVRDCSPFEIEIASSGSDQIPAERIQNGGNILRYKIQKLISSTFEYGKIGCLVEGVYYCTSSHQK
jgi:hypothetical protein